MTQILRHWRMVRKDMIAVGSHSSRETAGRETLDRVRFPLDNETRSALASVETAARSVPRIDETSTRTVWPLLTIGTSRVLTHRLSVGTLTPTTLAASLTGRSRGGMAFSM